jgi:hypothetical protein
VLGDGESYHFIRFGLSYGGLSYKDIHNMEILILMNFPLFISYVFSNNVLHFVRYETYKRQLTDISCALLYPVLFFFSTNFRNYTHKRKLDFKWQGDLDFRPSGKQKAVATEPMDSIPKL